MIDTTNFPECAINYYGIIPNPKFLPKEAEEGDCYFSMVDNKHYILYNKKWIREDDLNIKTSDTPCTCGAKHTSNPNHHTTWCDKAGV